MWKYCEILLLFCYLDWSKVQCIRTYDVYSEAIKLFGEDLTAVLKRFRRSPEYWDIMKERVDELVTHLDDIVNQVMYSYRTKILFERVNETLLNEFREEKKDKPNLRSVSSLDDMFPLRLFERQGQENSDNVTTTKSPVEILDDHELLHSPFTVSERNILRDVGFQVAQIAIQKIIESMGNAEDESELKSTRMPNYDKKDLTTTTEQTPAPVTTPAPTSLLRSHSKPPHAFKFGKLKAGKNAHNAQKTVVRG